MERFSADCQALLQNSAIPYNCPVSEDEETSVCCFNDCCFITRKKNDFWQTWYFWFGILLFGLLILSSFVSYLAGLCKRKNHNLIRVRHLSARLDSSDPTISTITGPDGIIQPRILYNKRSKISRDGNEKKETDKRISPKKHLASPLTPPYTPIKPVKIIRGSAPPMGYRQTSTYTELVLPPGYIQSRNNATNKY